MAADHPKHHLPAGVRAGHVEHLVKLPPPYKMRCLLGQLVDVRDNRGNRFLLAESATHWTLHRRLTPQANGHARNHVAPEPHAAFAKDGK